MKKLWIAAVLTFSQLALADGREAALKQAADLGAPPQAVQRAIKESRNGNYAATDVIGVFDLSQDADKKRFYLIDFKAGKTTAYHAAHGKGNGGHKRATNFRGFSEPSNDMTPLGALRTGAEVEVLNEDWEVRDRYDGKVYSGLYVLDLTGMKSYNSRFNRNDTWVILHSKWYVTEGYRKNNGGALGRSLGCIVIDPVYSNQVFKRLQGGALVYVTVGNDPVEKYL